MKSIDLMGTLGIPKLNTGGAKRQQDKYPDRAVLTIHDIPKEGSKKEHSFHLNTKALEALGIDEDSRIVNFSFQEDAIYIVSGVSEGHKVRKNGSFASKPVRVYISKNYNHSDETEFELEKVDAQGLTAFQLNPFCDNEEDQEEEIPGVPSSIAEMDSNPWGQ